MTPANGADLRPFWPRHSPQFSRLRTAVAALLSELPPRSPLIVACSGGTDSLALLAAAAAQARSSGHQICAVVVDHQLQPQSASAAALVHHYAQRFGVVAHTLRIEVDPQLRRLEGLEAAARQGRYQALARFAAGVPIALAHTGDDAAETLLLSALRGKVSGLPAWGSVAGATLVRPLLGLRREHTRGACEELQLQPWEDPHNQNLAFRRVAVRQQVLPLLAQLSGGDAAAALVRSAELLAEDEELLTQLAQPVLAAALRAGGAGLDAATVAAAPAALRRRALARWLHRGQVAPSAASLAAVEQLVTSWRGQGPVAVRPAPGRWRPHAGRWLEVARQGGTLFLNADPNRDSGERPTHDC